MKKIIAIIVLLTLALAGTAFAENRIKTKTICQTATVSASGSYTPVTLNLSSLEGSFSMQFQVSGSGTATMVYALSNDGVTYSLPTTGLAGEGAIFTGITATSGGGVNGIVFDDFTPEFAKYMQIGIWETAGADPISVTATVAYR